MTTLDDLLDAGDVRRAKTGEAVRKALAYLRAGLFWAGFAAAKLLVAVLTAIAAVCYGLGWIVARLWPGLCWCGNAVRLGWDDARAPRGARPR